jgi:hypothetical protein
MTAARIEPLIVPLERVAGKTRHMPDDFFAGSNTVQRLREAIADTWAETQLIHALHCIPRRPGSSQAHAGRFEFAVRLSKMRRNAL